MSGTEVSAAPAAPAVSLPCPLPAPTEEDPEELRQYRETPGDERTFLQLRRDFRQWEEWRALATLMVVHAANIDNPAKAAELCLRAYELWLERVKNKKEAAHALTRAVMLQPHNERAFERLRKLYDNLGWNKETVRLLEWRLDIARLTDPASVPALYLELAEIFEHQFSDIANAVQYYAATLQLDPSLREVADHLIDLYLEAGAWRQAAELLQSELQRGDAAQDPQRMAKLHIRLARIESTHLDNVASGARHLQAALKLRPDDIEALQAFGLLYLSSGKATQDGMSKAADIFFKAAQLARSQADHGTALKLLRRTLGLRPDHQEASAALEQTLIDAEDWLALDDLYREWLSYFSGADAVPLLLRRAQLLESRLQRREEARQLYEEASRYQAPDGEAWIRLQEIYAQSKDFHALAALLEAYAERMPRQVPTEVLLRIAQIHRDELGSDERAAVFYYQVLEREPFNPVAFEGYKEHWRRKHNWGHLRDLILYQIDRASEVQSAETPLRDPAFAEEFVELADICERRLGDVDGALATWHRMAATYPSDRRPREQIARIEKRARMWDNMVRVQEAELQRTTDPTKRLDILKRLTQVYRDRHVNPTRAIELYHEILEISPNDIQATRALTALYDRTGDYARVTELLVTQYERSRSNTERISLLRRLAELWHHELGSPEQAIWACEQILSHAPADREALHRIQQIYEEQALYDRLLETLDRELRVVTAPDDKIKLLRRMARVAERDLQDHDRAAAIWEQLLSLQPSSLEVIDKMIDIYEQTARVQDLADLLGKTASSAKTPVLRQQDYLLRLGYLAESTLGDPETARSAFERVLRLRPDHRGALEALVRLYREDKIWEPLAATLGTLQDLAESGEEQFRIAWERAEILADRLDRPEQAARVLEELPEEVVTVHPELAQSLLELYQRAGKPRRVVRQAELMLLATDTPVARRRLFEIISETWLRELEDRQAALATYERFVQEFPDDLDGLWTLANLQEEVGDFEGTLTTLERRLQLSADPDMQVTTLEHMSRVCETGLQDPPRGLELLRRAQQLAPTNEGIKDRIDTVAEAHDLWPALLSIYDERLDQMEQLDRVEEQVAVCLEGSRIAELQLSDAAFAFDWAKRGYFVAITRGLDPGEASARLQQLAEDHGLWANMLEVNQEEIELRDAHGDQEDTIVQRLLQAAEIAEHQLDDPARAVEYLQQAHARRPHDEDLAKQLETTAELHGLWQPIVDLYRDRLERAETDLGRLDAYTTIARLHEERLERHEDAFYWLRTAWRDLEPKDPSLASEALDAMVALAERRDLWAPLADHHLARAQACFEQGAIAEGLEALGDSARVHAEELGDPLAAIRVYARGLEHDPDGTALLPEIRPLAEDLDRNRESGVALGALAQLRITQRLIASASDPTKHVLLAERARLREERMDDVPGAMAEWTRLLRMDPEASEPRAELLRLVETHQCWSRYLLVPGWIIEKSTQPVEQADRYAEIGEIYEQYLGRPEYALRARIEAWRRQPTLPPRLGELDEDHARLWNLARETGAYHTPPVPKDPLLQPEQEAPELADEDRWQRAGLHRSIIDEAPSARPSPSQQPTGNPTSAETPAEVTQPSPPSEDTDVTKAPTASPVAMVKESSTEVIGLDDVEEVESTLEVAVDDIEEFEELEELEEIDDIEELEDEAATATPAGSPAEEPAPAPEPPQPPPPPVPPDAGLPPVITLSSPLLPPRPRVATAWDELALAYADYATASKHEKADLCLVLARLWEEGAGQVERAFQQYEQALLLVPEYDAALQGLQSLGERHDAEQRWLQALERLLGEAALPEHVVAQNLRIARLQQSREQIDAAERHYRGALQVQPHQQDALEALARIYESQQRWADYAEVYERLLDAEANTLTEDELVERTRRLANLLDGELSRTDDAVEHLERLLREFPGRQEPYRDLVDLLAKQGNWQKAVDTLRTAADTVLDEDFQVECLARIAEIYQGRLAIPERAITAWSQVLDARADDDRALENLQTLYTDTGRYDALLEVIERRLERTSQRDRDTRATLLIAKAEALQDGLGDEQAATTTLEQLLEEAPENDDVVIGLSRLYRKAGRFEDGIKLLRLRLQGVEQPDRVVRLAETLGRALWDEKKDLDGALQVVEQALAKAPEARSLLELRVELARARHDMQLLVEALAALQDAEALLEAADLARKHTKDRARAVRLYSHVLAEAKEHSEDPDHAARLATCIEGLVQLRIEDGDVDGAVEFMDKQLSETEGSALRARLLNELGRITYRVTGDVEAARARFDAALAEDPEYAPAKLGLGELLTDAEHFKEAERLLESAVDGVSLEGSREHLVEGLVLLARLLEQTDRAGEAYRRLTTALRHDPDDLSIRAAIVRNRHGAQRWRDVLTAVDQLEKRLASGIDVPERQKRTVAGMFVRAGQSELALKQAQRALARYRRALQIDPDNPEALAAIIPLSQEQGSLAEAAHHMEVLARQTEAAVERARRFFQAGILYQDAASAMADTGERETADGKSIDEIQRLASECAAMGVTLVEDQGEPVLDRAQLEVSFRTTARHHPAVALRILDRLLLHDDLEPTRRVDFLLEGARLALVEGDARSLERGEAFAQEARSLAPESSAAVLTLAELFEATNRVDHIEPLVEGYFSELDEQQIVTGDVIGRVALLSRLAELQASKPEKAIAALEQASSLDPQALGTDQRKRLARLYEDQGIEDDRALANHLALLNRDPLHIPSIAALAKHFAAEQELDRAHSLYGVLRLIDPDNAEATEFLGRYEVVTAHGQELDIEPVLPPEFVGGGIPQALTHLWQGGANLLAEHLPRIEVPQEARVSPVGETPLALSWGEVLRRLGQTKVALVDGVAEVHERPEDNVAGEQYFRIQLQQPPVIFAGPRAHDDGDPQALRFALARALFFTRPEAAFGVGIPKATLARILSATLQAFHPRHSRRKHHAPADDPTTKLSQELARKLPIRVSRLLSNTFKEHESEPFDSRQWRNWIRLGGNRVGLIVSGDLNAALRVLSADRGISVDELLQIRRSDDPEVRDLLAFATSQAYVEARRKLGFSVTAIS